jgi:hypothetical protein
MNKDRQPRKEVYRTLILITLHIDNHNLIKVDNHKLIKVYKPIVH